jgi:hypothetical protein
MRAQALPEIRPRCRTYRVSFATLVEAFEFPVKTCAKQRRAHFHDDSRFFRNAKLPALD